MNAPDSALLQCRCMRRSGSFRVEQGSRAAGLAVWTRRVGPLGSESARPSRCGCIGGARGGIIVLIHFGEEGEENS